MAGFIGPAKIEGWHQDGLDLTLIMFHCNEFGMIFALVHDFCVG
ncbi:MAG: hypothetical protein ACLPV8_28655 [Steroidobacteraceae bacterium]